MKCKKETLLLHSKTRSFPAKYLPLWRGISIILLLTVLAYRFKKKYQQRQKLEMEEKENKTSWR